MNCVIIVVVKQRVHTANGETMHIQFDGKPMTEADYEKKFNDGLRLRELSKVLSGEEKKPILERDLSNCDCIFCKIYKGRAK